MASDPKFGYHIWWIAPCLWAIIMWEWITEAVRNFIHEIKFRSMLRKNPEVKTLAKLAGVVKPNE